MENCRRDRAKNEKCNDISYRGLILPGVQALGGEGLYRLPRIVYDGSGWRLDLLRHRYLGP